MSGPGPIPGQDAEMGMPVPGTWSHPNGKTSQCFRCDSTQVMHVALLATFAFLALVSVLFRLWSRKIQRMTLALNDYLCIVGLVGSSLYLVNIGLSAA